MNIAHRPVMLAELRTSLVPPRADSLMVDCTLGEGGHAESFLGSHPSLRYIGIDADREIQDKARERLASFGSRMAFKLGWFDEVLASMAAEVAAGAQARPELMLMDLGISMFHFTESGRGFSHARDEALDMRLSAEGTRTAADIVNGLGEEELANLIYEFGEERHSRRIAHGIALARRQAPITTSSRLEEIVFSAMPGKLRHGHIHPATRTFQALRISVNDELGRAARGIALAASLLAPGGRLAVITFHSLEDRIAKNIFRVLCNRGDRSSLPADILPIIVGMENVLKFQILTKKPLEPSESEVAGNAASRSAKLRVLERARDAGVER
ncbi:MAG: 16S rRNA (cytosine(1402)-N(4))-methyltransferase RsmH [Spirochaetota bacterium]